MLSPEQDAALSSLMRNAQAGDSACYESLLKEAAELVRPFLAARLPSADVEDATQEVLLSIHSARHTFEAGRPFAPWMYAIARYRLADFQRRNARRARRQSDDEAALLAAPGADERAAIETRAELAGALARLPERQRAIVELLKLEGLSVAEIARRLGMSESAVKVAAHRGYEAVRKHWEAQDDEDR